MATKQLCGYLYNITLIPILKQMTGVHHYLGLQRRVTRMWCSCYLHLADVLRQTQGITYTVGRRCRGLQKRVTKRWCDYFYNSTTFIWDRWTPHMASRRYHMPLNMATWE